MVVDMKRKERKMSNLFVGDINYVEIIFVCIIYWKNMQIIVNTCPMSWESVPISWFCVWVGEG